MAHSFAVSVPHLEQTSLPSAVRAGRRPRAEPLAARDTNVRWAAPDRALRRLAARRSQRRPRSMFIDASAGPRPSSSGETGVPQSRLQPRRGDLAPEPRPSASGEATFYWQLHRAQPYYKLMRWQALCNSPSRGNPDHARAGVCVERLHNWSCGESSLTHGRSPSAPDNAPGACLHRGFR